MRGDFSKWVTNLKQNYNGLLQQQGRVFLDSDWNEQVRISEDRRQTMLRDVVGANVVAVPAELPESLKVTKAEVTADNKIWLDINAGRVWINGMSLDIGGDLKRTASYLSSSIGTVGDIGDGIRDAVILELWQEELNSFQYPKRLLESALGSPDTTEKMHTGMALRLLRLNADENCRNIKGKLASEDNNRGKLSVTLEPDSTTSDECPLVETGGYAGFEHNLYRIEIAHANQSPVKAKFKWSTVNGGLVGRGTYDFSDPLNKKIILTANQPAIVNSQKDNFYLEIVEYDAEAGRTVVTFGAEATLNGNVLEIGLEHYVTTAPGTPEVFFRLWDGIKLVSDFPKTGDAKELKHGIRLAFDDEASVLYRAEDYWTFDIRVGQKSSSSPLIDNEIPQGIVYHRAPLGILNWDVDKAIEEEQIDDCRRIFRPLTDLDGCCTLTVGNGGDFDTIQKAVKALPDSGGQICLLPGIYRENVTIADMENVVIKGCDKRTVVMPAEKGKPIFHIIGSKCITLEHIDMEAYGGTGILIERSETGQSSEINVLNNRILACINAIRVEDEDGEKIKILRNIIRMLDKEGGDVAIFIQATDSLIEDNDITVVPADILTPEEDIPEVDRVPNPTDPCADPDIFFKYRPFLTRYVNGIWAYVLKSFPVKQFKAPGGIQIAGRSEGIKVHRNLVSGGYWNGITLGHIPSEYKEVSEEIKTKHGLDTLGSQGRLVDFQEKFESFIEDLSIEGNEIRNMGLNGIGVVGFFSLKNIAIIVSVEDLTIYRNHIEGCLKQIPSDISTNMKQEMGFGGVSLSDCENLVIRENRIEDNGKSHVEPVSGIFILHGEKIDISDNRILNNGPRTPESDDNARPGMRGGIVIGLNFKKAFYELFGEQEFPAPDGIPSVKIHDNIVTQPLGQALFIMAFGPVSVVGNHLTSQGADYRANPLSLIAGAVFILNLGVSKDLVGMLLLSSFKMMTNTAPMSSAMVAPTTGLRSALYLPSGNVLFSNNQTTLDLRAPEPNYTLSSQFIASLDDVSYIGNQSECSSFIDLVISNAVIFGVTVRTNDNRFQEGITKARYSLFSYGLMNTCATNQATHCLHVLGNPGFRVYADNKVLMNTNCTPTLKKIYMHYNIKTEAITTDQ